MVTRSVKVGASVFIVLFIRLKGIESIFSDLSPEQVINLLNKNVSICKSLAEDSGGKILQVNGHCVTLGWDQSQSSFSDINHKNFACDLLRKIRNYCASSISKDREFYIVASLAKGECIYELSDNQFSHIYGMPLSIVVQISNKHTVSGLDILIVDRSMSYICAGSECENLGDGICAINCSA